MEEVAHQRRNLLPLVFERKVARVEQVELCVGQIAQVGARALRGEDDVVLSPDDKGGRAAGTEEGLKLRIESDVRAVVFEEIKHDLVDAGAVEEGLVVYPRVGGDARQVAHAVDVL